MKKLFLLAAVSSLYISTFAFEGTIEQIYVNPETQVQMTFLWYLNGDDVRLDILNGEESMTLIPDFEVKSLNMFGVKPDNDGNYWYSNTPLGELVVNVPSVRLLESTAGSYQSKPAQEVKVMTDSGLMVVQYVDYIQVNMENMLAVFAESVEFKAVSLASSRGFPVSSILMTSEDAIYTLTTKAIQEKVIEAGTFKVPSNYKLFSGIK
ncbi:MAG: hypothetical protein QNK51_02990 [Chitinophagales bacterium]|tara:strand:+ start:9256 stop:9879 length:624 start_codon:yes stop_codon:yes gene_type:complete